MKTLLTSLMILLFISSFAQAPVISYSSPHEYTAGTAITALTPTNTGGAVSIHASVSTIIGSVNNPFVGQASGLAFNSTNSILYTGLHNIWTVKQIALPSAVASVLAGSGVAGFAEGTGSAAQFGASGSSTTPYGVAVHPLTGEIYVADPGNNRIRKISTSGVVTTFAGDGTAGATEGPIASATFSLPTDLYFAANGDLYVLQSTRIRKIYKDVNGDLIVGTVMSGIPTNCFCFTYYNGDFYIADKSHKIHKVTEVDKTISVFAGSGTAGSADGTGTAATFNNPRGIKADQFGNIYVADYSNARIRKINPDGVVTTIAGPITSTISTGSTDGEGAAAKFNGPFGLVFDVENNLYIGDAGNSKIRKITFSPYSITPALPAGLLFNTTTGEISGTPTTITPAADYTITGYNTSGSSVAVVNITIKDSTTGLTDNKINKDLSFVFENNNILIKGNVNNNTIATLYNLQGKIIVSKSLETDNLNTISTATSLSGLYLLKINNGIESQCYKILIK